ncbi:nucleotidyltransferase domain-containing protein [Nocardioides sp. YIM 152315]|uniref:nucleotidyltransferase family protein n=1 Tax=Nocardioides sp. YIM 152315 TaxID=3031760 RepID=UPI0023DC14A7|nr:nucleotidyltransferase domain-containing protein [Nocardioides sp. YIM 152315]MDF1606091.1 nucleotidyltransferase domain-containing protein [Nocardioides sp. YIM 152315]
MSGPLVLDREAIGELCRRFGVSRMVVFGSAVTEAFDETASDVDFLVEFADSVESRFDAYFGLKESLEALLGRPVDLVAPAALRNPYFADSVARTGQELYAS